MHILVEIFVDKIGVERSRELLLVPAVMSFQPLAEFDQHLWVDGGVRVGFMESDWLRDRRDKKRRKNDTNVI